MLRLAAGDCWRRRRDSKVGSGSLRVTDIADGGAFIRYIRYQIRCRWEGVEAAVGGG